MQQIRPRRMRPLKTSVGEVALDMCCAPPPGYPPSARNVAGCDGGGVGGPKPGHGEGEGGRERERERESARSKDAGRVTQRGRERLNL